MTMSQANVPDDLRPIVEEVVRRDRRRIRMLAFTTIALWVLAILLVPAFFLPLAAKFKMSLGALPDVPGSAATQPVTAHQLAGILTELLPYELLVTGIMVGVVLLASLLASISTVALALTIRRVTLRQVSASLAQISEQLRQLRAQGG